MGFSSTRLDALLGIGKGQAEAFAWGVQDLELDVPDAETLLALFLARSLVDEALPPSALNALATSLPSGCPALNVVQLTGTPEPSCLYFFLLIQATVYHQV